MTRCTCLLMTARSKCLFKSCPSQIDLGDPLLTALLGPLMLLVPCLDSLCGVFPDVLVRIF